MLHELFEMLSTSSHQIQRYYKESKDEIARSNVMLLVFISICGFSLVGILLCLTPYIIPDWNITIGHVLFLPFFLFYFLGGLYLHNKKKVSHKLVHILVVSFLLIFMGLVLYINFVPFPNSSGTMATVAMVVLPVLLILPFHEVVIILLVIFLGYIYLNMYFISDTYKYSNYFNGLVGLLGGVMVGWVISSTRAKENKDRQSIVKMSEQDKLTGIMNKGAVEEKCKEYLENNAENPCTMLIIDVDYFKSINDTFGHHMGDIVLGLFGESLRHVFREQDWVGRIGGDEFLVFLRSVPDPDLVIGKMEHLLQIMQEKVSEKMDLHVSCSYGAIVKDTQDYSYLELFNMADKLLYRAKKNGKSQGLALTIEDYQDFMSRDKVMLVVDDTEDMRAMVREAFREIFVSMEASNGQETLKLITKYHSVIDVMILDIVMPDMDGFAILDWMKEHGYMGAFPVVVLSSDKSTELKALEYGVEEMIVKPVMPEVLQKRVEKVLRFHM